MTTWERRWPEWQPSPDSAWPAQRGGCTQLAAYEAGLTDDPGVWIQEIDVSDPKANPSSPDYDPDYHAMLALEEPDPESARMMKAYEGWSYPEPEREPPDWEAEPF
jgi:hypothetical protein